MGKIKSIRKTLSVFASFFIFASFFSVAPARGDATSTPPVVASHDAFVQPGTTTSATSNVIILKNATPGASATTSIYNRVGYMRFEYDPRYVWESAALEMVVAGNADGASNNGYNRTYTTFNVDVFGATDASWDNTISFTSANASTQDWGLNTATWPWSIDNGTFLGTISIPTSSTTVGRTYSLSSEALTNFLNDDTDGAVTLYIRRSDTDNQANLTFASTENTTTGYFGPRLVVPDANYSYTIAYDINGGTGTLPQPGQYSTSTSYTVASSSTLVPPVGKTFAGWNSRSDGSGISYYAGETYTTPASLTLYAQYTTNPVITLNENYGQNRAGYQTVPSNTLTNLGSNPFTRVGYTFIGWTTNSDGSGTLYSDQASISTSSSLSLYAKWSVNQYTVTFAGNGNDHGSPPTSGTGDFGSVFNVPIGKGSLEKSGFRFTGWNSRADGTGSSVLSDGTGQFEIPASNTVLYAQWAQNPSQVLNWALPSTDFALTTGRGLPASLPNSDGSGTISYSVANSGSTGCTVNSETGEITFTKIGNCLIRATAAATADYGEGYIEKNFTVISENSQVALELKLGLGSALETSGAEFAVYGLQPGSHWDLVVRSTPQIIQSGTYSGSLQTGLAALPTNLEPGWHSITLTGTATDGRPISTVYLFEVNSSGVITSYRSAGDSAVDLANTGFDIESTGVLSISLASLGLFLLIISRRVRRKQ